MIKKEKVDDQKKAEDMKNMIMFGKLSPEMEANEGRIAAKVEAQRIAKAAQDEYAKMLVDGIDEGAVLEVCLIKQASNYVVLTSFSYRAEWLTIDMWHNMT